MEFATLWSLCVRFPLWKLRVLYFVRDVCGVKKYRLRQVAVTRPHRGKVPFTIFTFYTTSVNHQVEVKSPRRWENNIKMDLREIR
jgi:hypothetical protein